MRPAPIAAALAASGVALLALVTSGAPAALGAPTSRTAPTRTVTATVTKAGPTTTVTAPGPTVTVAVPGPTVTVPGPTVTAPGPTVTVTAPAATPSPTTPALWVGDYQDGTLSQFQNATWNYLPNAPAVGTAPGGGTAAAYSIPPGGSRCETVPNFRSIVEGDDLWFGLSTYLEPGFPVNTGWQVLYQWKNDGTGSPPLELIVNQNTATFRIDGGYGHPSGLRMSGRDLGPVVTGQWVRWVVHVRFSSDPTVGTVDVWRDGSQLVAGFHPTGGTLYPGLSSYVKNGYYRDSAITTPGRVWDDDLRIGTSQASVA